jgi:hypothetical protein
VPDEQDLDPDLQLISSDLRDAFIRDLEPEATARYLAAVLAVSAATREPVGPLAGRRRRRGLVAAVTLAGVLGASGLAAAAATGALPAALQDGFAKAAHPMGIDLPTSTGRGSGPGHSDDAPGQGGTSPGKSDEAPGQQDQPGKSEDAPGLGGENPGRSDTAPGQTGDPGNNKPVVPPGQVDHPGQGSGNGNSNGNGPPTSVPGNGNGPPSSVPGNGVGPPTSVPGQGRPGGPPRSTPPGTVQANGT